LIIEPARDCAQVVRDSETFSRRLADSARGREAYRKVLALMDVNPKTYREARDAAVQRGDTLRDFLRFVRDDRERIALGLEKISRGLAAESDEQQIILYTLKYVRKDQRPNETEDQEWQRLLLRCGLDCDSPLAALSGYPHVNQAFEDFVGQYYVAAYSYVAELLTAFELKGFTGMGFHARQIFNSENQAKLVAALERRGRERLAEIEIDAASFDPVNSKVTWFEVKLVNHPADADSAWIDRVRERITTVKKFISFVQSDPDLRKAWPYKLEMRFVFRGAGATPEFIDQLKSQYGIIAYDRDVSGYNAEYGHKK